eukprot:2785553-Karenia_brevis.AAC.1
MLATKQLLKLHQKQSKQKDLDKRGPGRPVRFDKWGVGSPKSKQLQGIFPKGNEKNTCPSAN